MSSEAILPPAFTDSMKALLGTAYGDFLNALSEKSPVSIRLNKHRNFSVETAAKIPWCDTGRYLSERPVFTLDPAFHAGAYYVQEASSMFLEQALLQNVDLSRPIIVLDLCAAPGGKSTHLLNLINSQSLLVSNEVIRSRATILSENIQKWGNNNIVVTQNDPEGFQHLKGFFDVIVVDAPCSGEGLFRKDPDAMNEWSPENVAHCSKRQKRILSDIWPCLKKDGLLIYSTCTYNSYENEEAMAWVKTQYDAESVPVRIEHEWGIEEVTEGSTYGYHFFPHRVQGEGFFISIIRKGNPQPVSNQKIKTRLLSRASSRVVDQIKDWTIEPQNNQFLMWKDNILMVPDTLADKIEWISQHLHIVNAGTTIGEVKQNKIIPDHALALSININKTIFNQLDVSKALALQYLRKETWPVESDKKGFSLITHNNLVLGWVNVLDNRINNMYPPHWRIRM